MMEMGAVDDLDPMQKYNKLLINKLYEGYDKNTAGKMAKKGFRKKGAMTKLMREDSKMKKKLLDHDIAYGNAVEAMDDEGKLRILRKNQSTRRKLKRRKNKKKKRKPMTQELIIVKTPYGEARFFKNSDGTRTKVRLPKKKKNFKPGSPIGMESRPVEFHKKLNLKEYDDIEDDDEPMMKDDPIDIFNRDPVDITDFEGNADDLEQQSQAHTESTIVESAQIIFGNGLDDSKIVDKQEETDQVAEMYLQQKEDATRFSKNEVIKNMPRGGSRSSFLNSDEDQMSEVPVGLKGLELNSEINELAGKRQNPFSSLRSLSSKRSEGGNF